VDSWVLHAVTQTDNGGDEASEQPTGGTSVKLPIVKQINASAVSEVIAT
jgi:hypothetical protein